MPDDTTSGGFPAVKPINPWYAALWAVVAFFTLGIGLYARAQVAQVGTNTPLVGCVEGRALRVVNGNTGCAPAGAPTLTTCGTSPSLSGNATDFVGQITTGTGIVTSCTLVMTKLYSSPGLGCIAQTNSITALAGNPVIGTSGGKTTMTVTLGLSLPGGKITYICAPV